MVAEDIRNLQGGPGHDRRPSFRDPPTPYHAHLVVEASPAQPPETCLLVSGLTIHRLEPSRWVLQFQGALLADGVPVARVAEGYLAASPLEMVRNCIGTVGDHRDSHLGVRTPALLIEHLGPA